MESRKKFKTLSLIAFSCILFLSWSDRSTLAAEKDYPNKSITLINPYAPGGGVDIAYRPIIDILPDYLGQKIVVSHKPGATGSIGTAFAAKAKPDGYTLLAGSTSHVNLAPATRKVPYTPSDFVSVGTFAKAIDALAVKADAPWKTLQEFVADAKRNPGKYKVSTFGVMGAAHFCMELFDRAAGIKVGHIPYNSDSEALTAAIGGHTDVVVATVQAAIPHLSSGALRALAVSDTVRYNSLPDVPTFKELGYEVRVIIWFGMLAPKGTPKEIINKLWNAQKKGFEENKLPPILERIGMIPFLRPPEEMDKIIREDHEMYTKAAKEFGFEIK
jgi:tripartite-type tricarboxylate transporter receptor subunit TctC